MRIARLPKSTQFFLGGILIGLTAFLLAFTAVPAVLVIVIVLAVAAAPLLMTGAITKGRDAVLADRLATDVARASLAPPLYPVGSQTISLGGGEWVTVVTPDPCWREARERIERQIDYVRMQGRLIVGSGLIQGKHGLPRLVDMRLTAEHRAMLANLLLRLDEARVIAAKHAELDGGSGSRDADADIQAIKRTIYELIGSAATAVNVEALRAEPSLDRFFTATAECEQGHLGTPDVTHVLTGDDGAQRVGRACRYCPSIWNEKA